MGRFHFRLQPVLEHRQRIVDEKRRVLGQKARELADAREVVRRLAADRDGRRIALTRDHGTMTSEMLRATYAHLAYLDRTIDDELVRVAACEAELARAQTQLLEADMDRQVLDTLKARRHEAFKADVALAEQREVDDQNARRYRGPRPRDGS